MALHRSQLSLALGINAAFLLSACQENSQSPSGQPEPPRPDAPEASVLGPVDLVYVCGNKFLATNATRSAMHVMYRVAGSDEAGDLTLRPGRDEDQGFSETELQTIERGVVELYQGDDRVARRRNQGLPCGASPASIAAAVVGVSGSAGEWSAPFPWPVVAVHLSLLPTGKVLSWGLAGTPQVWDPTTGIFTSVPSPSLLFCAGQSLLADGRLLVAGGNNNPTISANGLPNINLFTPGTQSWTPSSPMRRGRWYPTTTTLGNGDVVILAGKDEAGVFVQEPEVWSPGTLPPRVLSTARLLLPLYPRSFLAPNGKVFVAGEDPDTRYLDPSTGSWTTVAPRRYSVRDYGAAVMYDVGKILYAGGGRTTNTAEIIDLNLGTPTWQWTGSMAYPRRHLNATVLPTGEVLVTGGSSGTAFNDWNAPVHAAELWNPATGLWTTLASNTVNRVYHSTSILLPDGRILHTGSGDAGPDQRNAELFSPPYLFKGPRPTITGAPTLIGYGTSFTVTTPQAADIAKVSLIRLGSTTHAFDMNQRFQWLSFTPGTGTLTISIPTSRDRTPPGHYMLFILDGNGVPSVARIVKVGNDSDPPPPSSSSIALSVTGRTDATRQYMSLTWTGGSGATLDVYRNGAFLTNTPNTHAFTDSRTFIGAANYAYKVCEAGTVVCSNQKIVFFTGRTAAPIPLTVVAWTDATTRYLSLIWTGASGANVDVWRNTRLIKTTPNTGRYINTVPFLGAGTYRYKVCQAGTTTCSGVATLVFDGSPVTTRLLGSCGKHSSDQCRVTSLV